MYTVNDEIEIFLSNGQVLFMEVDVECGIGHEDFWIESVEIKKMITEDDREITSETLAALMAVVLRQRDQHRT